MPPRDRGHENLMTLISIKTTLSNQNFPMPENEAWYYGTGSYFVFYNRSNL